MKTINRMEEILIKILREKVHNIEIEPQNYYNEYLQNSSIILSSILQQYLESYSEWNSNKWIDDILIRNVKHTDNIVYILGNTIWGKEGATKEWVSPILFQIFLTDDWVDFIEYNFYFEIKNENELDYNDYSKKRKEWDEYFNQNFSTKNGSWKYEINNIR